MKINAISQKYKIHTDTHKDKPIGHISYLGNKYMINSRLIVLKRENVKITPLTKLQTLLKNLTCNLLNPTFCLYAITLALKRFTP